MRVTQAIASVLVAVGTAQSYGPLPPYSQGPHGPPDPRRGPPGPLHRTGGYGPPPPFHPPPPFPIAPKPISAEPKTCPQEPCCLNKRLRKTPQLNTLLFDECPLHKTDKAVCEAATKEFAKYGTALTVKKDYHPKNIKLIPNKGYERDNVRAYSKVTHGSDDRKYKRVVHPAVVQGKWYSDTNADLVAIRRGCCFNIYGDVHFGDKLDTECENEVVGDPDQLYTLLKYSVITPGRFTGLCRGPEPAGPARRRLKGPTYCNLSNPVIVGSDLVLSTLWQIDYFNENVGQFWNGVSLQVGRDIQPDLAQGGSILLGDDTVPDGGGLFEQYVNGLNGDRVIEEGAMDTLTAVEVEESRLVAQTRVCAFSDQLKSQTENAECVLSGSGDDVVLDVTCTDTTARNCVANCSKDDVEAAVSIIIMSEGSQVIINVDGETIDVELATLVVPTDVSAVFNFHKAVTLKFVAPDINASIVTPRALRVAVGSLAGIRGALLNGNPESTTSLGLFRVDGRRSPPPSPLAPVKPEVTLCTCLCQQEDCDH